MKKKLTLVLESAFSTITYPSPNTAQYAFNVTVPDGNIQASAQLYVESFQMASAPYNTTSTATSTYTSTTTAVSQSTGFATTNGTGTSTETTIPNLTPLNGYFKIIWPDFNVAYSYDSSF